MRGVISVRWLLWVLTASSFTRTSAFPTQLGSAGCRIDWLCILWTTERHTCWLRGPWYGCGPKLLWKTEKPRCRLERRSSKCNPAGNILLVCRSVTKLCSTVTSKTFATSLEIFLPVEDNRIQFEFDTRVSKSTTLKVKFWKIFGVHFIYFLFAKLWIWCSELWSSVPAPIRLRSLVRGRDGSCLNFARSRNAPFLWTQDLHRWVI